LVSPAKLAARQPKSNILRMMFKDIPLQACGEHVKVNQSKMTTTLSLQMNVQVSKIQAKSSSKCMLGRLLENVNQQQTSLCAAAFQFLKQGTNCLRKIRYKNCPMHAKERTAILKQSGSNSQLLLTLTMESVLPADTDPDGKVKQTTFSSEKSINHERVSPTYKVTTDINRCNVCLADV